MDNNRDMFYSGYSYGMVPMNNMNPNSYINNWNQDINNRLNNLDRKINRLEQRITRLETPYQNNFNNQEPDNNIYIMFCKLFLLRSGHQTG